jgi:hypothetical protein
MCVGAPKIQKAQLTADGVVGAINFTGFIIRAIMFINEPQVIVQRGNRKILCYDNTFDIEHTSVLEE